MNEAIWISTGSSRKETKWKNKELSWQELVEKLSETKRTPETIKEYLSSSRDRQSEIKDIGGFVGGVISGGRRNPKSVTSRHLLTLDLDKPTSDFWLDFKLTYHEAACTYSTHSHTPESPRLRLVMPLAREVHTDEYEAIARKVADVLGLEQFDPTTFQPERLMYWPSTAKDGEFVFDSQEGAWLDPDRVLSSYADWRDTSQWPMHQAQQDKIKRGMTKQGDPTEKPGLIGVFCRTYGVREAIEKFLSDVYEPTSYDDRYTYSGASTSAGLIVYDNKFTYSHHSTDPTCERTCNAFDLVRIHKFGESDANAGVDTPTNKLPSFNQMTTLAIEDEEVKKNMLVEQMQEAGEDFKNNDDDFEWIKKLEVDKKGNCYNTIENVLIIFEHDQRINNNIYFDDFDKRILLRRDLPWRKVTKHTNALTDSDDAAFRNYLEKVYKITNSTKIEDAIDIIAHRNLVHPVRDYLKTLTWDGTKRLDTLLIDFFGAHDDQYTRAVTRKTFVGAVARVFEPGIKFDTVLTLVGNQGIGKSEIISRMGQKWYSDTFGSLHNKDAMEQIQGVWLMEIGELAGLKKAEIETIKLFITKKEDRFRVAYGKRVESFPRQCVFIATTNDTEFLQDPTGNRRFWPVTQGETAKLSVFNDLTKKMVDQLWAEACHWYTMGEDLFLDEETEAMAREVQLNHTERDERRDIIVKYLNALVPENWYELDTYQRIGFINGDETIGKGVMLREKITVAEIWVEAMRGSVKDMTYFNTKYIRTIMRSMKDWRPWTIKTKDYGTQRGFVRSYEKEGWKF